MYLRLPTDVVERIEAKAKGEGRPFNRILVNELALFPHLDRQARLGELVRDMETVLARYGSRITVTELNEALLHAVDEALAAETDAQLQPLLERLRVIRRTMLESERRVATLEDDQLAVASTSSKRQIREIEAPCRRTYGTWKLPSGSAASLMPNNAAPPRTERGAHKFLIICEH
jgi:hypothetical protein